MIENWNPAAAVVAALGLLGSFPEPVLSAEPKADLAASPEDLRWWRDARFGLFIHWGPVSIVGTEIGWSRGGERRGTGGKGEIPLEVYDNLDKKFNPTAFDARKWVSTARGAGMKYLVFTAKHHDGFSMFDTKLSDYKITNSPFRRDVTAEIAQACHEGGLRLGFYYSPPDWRHPDYRTERHGRYVEYLHGQIRELCTNYGKLDILWFDGLGGTAKDWDSENLIRMVRGLQPGILINDRAGLPCDFGTPEQTIGAFQTDRTWESCITIGDQWAWKPGDRIKSLPECIDILARCAGGDGNLLFNVGPMPTGEIEPRQVERLLEMGKWLHQAGPAIYGTRGGPFRPGPWGACTSRGSTVYLHVLQADLRTLRLPPIEKKILRSSLLGGGEAAVKVTPEAIEVSLPPAGGGEIDRIVELELDGLACEARPGKLASGSLAAGKKATASNVYQRSPAHGPDKAVDEDETTRWATDAGVHEAWLEVDLEKPLTFARAYLSEEYDRVKEWALEYKDGETWRPFAKGEKIGKDLEIEFPPVTARLVRLDIRKASDGPTIWEFRLFAKR